MKFPPNRVGIHESRAVSAHGHPYSEQDEHGRKDAANHAEHIVARAVGLNDRRPQGPVRDRPVGVIRHDGSLFSRPGIGSHGMLFMPWVLQFGKSPLHKKRAVATCYQLAAPEKTTSQKACSGYQLS